jgi:hypothetical protein
MGSTAGELRFDFQYRLEVFFLIYSVQNGSKAHLAVYPKWYPGLFPKYKEAGAQN